MATSIRVGANRRMMPGRSRQSLVERTFRSLGGVVSWMQGYVRSTYSDEGLSLSQIWVLRHLVHRGSSTPKELADALEVTTGDMTGLLDKLEASGFATRRRSTQDRRKVHVEPTQKARDRFGDLHRAILGMLGGVFEEWRTDELEEFDRLLRKFLLARDRFRPGAA